MTSILEPGAPAILDRADHPFAVPRLKPTDSKLHLRFAVVEAVAEARGIKGDVRILQSALVKSNQQRREAEERAAQLAAENQALRVQIAGSTHRAPVNPRPPVNPRNRSTSEGVPNMGQANSTLASPRRDSKAGDSKAKPRPHRTSSFGRPLQWPVISYLKEKFVSWGHRDGTSSNSSSTQSSSTQSSSAVSSATVEHEGIMTPKRSSLSKTNGLLGVRRSRSDTAADGGYRRRRGVDLGARPELGARDKVALTEEKRSLSYDACCLPDVVSPRSSAERDVVRRRNQAIEEAFCRHYDQYLPPELESRCPVGDPGGSLPDALELRVFRQSNYAKKDMMPSVLFQSTDLHHHRSASDSGSSASQSVVAPKIAVQVALPAAAAPSVPLPAIVAQPAVLPQLVAPAQPAMLPQLSASAAQVQATSLLFKTMPVSPRSRPASAAAQAAGPDASPRPSSRTASAAGSQSRPSSASLKSHPVFVPGRAL